MVSLCHQKHQENDCIPRVSDLKDIIMVEFMGIKSQILKHGVVAYSIHVNLDWHRLSMLKAPT